MRWLAAFVRRLTWPPIIAAAGILLCGIGLFQNARSTFAAWLTASAFFLGLPLGAMTILMIHALTGGRWGAALRPPLRAMVATLPLALLFLVPVLFRLDLVFPWAGADLSALPDTVRQKLAYLNQPFFVIRVTLCCAVWLILGWLVLGWTAPQTQATPGRSARGGAVGLIVHAVAVSIFSIDWILSIEPVFTSTIYPMLEASAQVVGACAVALVALASHRAIETRPGGEEGVALGEDVANMLFGFVLMWAYLSFMQWIVVWAGDLPNDIHWYVTRGARGWQYVLWALIAVQFIAPFSGFLRRDLKRSHNGLVWLAGTVLAGHLLDVIWRVRPPLSAAGASFGWLDPAAFAATGGLWLTAFLFFLARPEWTTVWHRRLVNG